MKIVPISVELIGVEEKDENFTINTYKRIEEAGRTCYKSSNKDDKLEITESFIKGLIKSGHTSVLEHMNLSVRIVCDRGTSHQLVRHRHIGVSQQSTRYVSSLGDMEVIKPVGIEEGTEEFKVWSKSIEQAESNYQKMMEVTGNNKDLSRAVLPMSLKTELVITTNIREWRQIIEQRSSKYAHENIRELSRQLLDVFRDKLPVLFEDLVE